MEMTWSGNWNAIKLRWLGHSCFRVEYGGSAVVIDPFALGSVPGLRDIQETADGALCSHEHHDHNYREGVELTGKGAGMKITPLASFHDDTQGSQRGPNLIHLLEAGGVRVAHMGDIGCMPAPAILEKLRGVDAVMIPVGGHYTVGPKEALEIVQQIGPRVVIPMHYRSESFGFDVIGPVEDYLEICGPWRRYPGPEIVITPEMEPHTAVLTYQ